MLKHQLVMQGSTWRTFPNGIKGLKYKETMKGENTKGHMSYCFVPEVDDKQADVSVAKLVTANVGSFCATGNHWSDDLTSKGYVQDIVKPYAKQMCEN
jgi:hypothetical protein